MSPPSNDSTSIGIFFCPRATLADPPASLLIAFLSFLLCSQWARFSQMADKDWLDKNYFQIYIRNFRFRGAQFARENASQMQQNSLAMASTLSLSPVAPVSRTSSSFCLDDNLTYVKHVFQAHCSESNFHYVCGITVIWSILKVKYVNSLQIPMRLYWNFWFLEAM